MKLHLYLYNEIGGEDGIQVDYIREQINSAPDAKEIVVHISSPGGGVYDGWTIGNIIKQSGKKSIAQVEGLCASIATYIALSCDVVEMSETARWMTHKPEVELQGNADDLRSGAEYLDKIQDDIAKAYAKKTGKSIAIANEWMNAETWLNTDEAIEYGFVDRKTKSLKSVAKFDLPKAINKNNDKMVTDKEFDKEQKSFIDRLNAIIDKAKGIKFLTPKNMTVELADGNKIFIESEDGEFEGKKAFTVDAEGNPTETPAPAGDHNLIDGRTITVGEDGVVTAVKETPEEGESEEMKALKSENEELKNQLAALQNKEEELVEENKVLSNNMEETKSVVNELITEVNNLKKVTVGGSFKATKAYTKPENKFTQGKPEPVNRLGNWVAKIAEDHGIPVKQ